MKMRMIDAIIIGRDQTVSLKKMDVNRSALTLTETTTNQDITHGTSEIANVSSRPRDVSMSLFSHEHLDEADFAKLGPVIPSVSINDSRRNDSLSGYDSRRVNIANPDDDIFSPVVEKTQASLMPPSPLSPSPPDIGRDNVHVSSPRPRPLPRIIRRTRSEILTRTTNIRPPLHQIIEEDSISDFRSPRLSNSSSRLLIEQPRTPNEAIDQSAAGFAKQHGPQDNDEGIRQRKVSGGTTDSQSNQSNQNINRDVDTGDGNGNILPVANPAMPPAPSQQEEEGNQEEEYSKSSIWEWLLRCLRRRTV